MQNVTSLFLDLIAFDTQSRYESTTYPSTPAQLAFAQKLVKLCAEYGLTDGAVDAYGYVTATLPARNAPPNAPVIGLIAHMDTSGDAPGGPIRPRIVEGYDGGDIPVNADKTLSPKAFPHLKKYIGQDLIVTDGQTLLGADDKAGIAEILTAVGYLAAHPEIAHGPIKIAFTPDEEVGRGVNHFDVAAFGADFAYTIDGGEIGELESETFNAARALFTVNGVSVHPGYAIGTMRNAALVAAEMIAAFPPHETPARTEGYDGFYHLVQCEGDVSRATFSCLIRDFDAARFAKRKAFIEALAADFNTRYGADTVHLQIIDEYRNMSEILSKHQPVIDRAEKAMREAGVTPLRRPVRGGTDGARLSFMGLPCPNLFAGGHNFHGPFEYIPIPSMESAVKVIVNLCKSCINCE